MEQYFASLSKRQTMLLLTAVAFGGATAVESFDHLPNDEAELLKHRALGLLQIPRDKRVPFLVQEIKQLVTQRRKQLAHADPARLVEVLAGERAATIELVARGLQSEMADALRGQLLRASVKFRREVRADVLSIVRWKLEELLKQSTPKVGLFKFSDLLTLQSREIIAICDRMGARALATALAGLPDEDREDFFEALPPDQRSLAVRACEAGRAKRLTEGDSRTVLGMHGALENPSSGMRSAGVQRLARACVAQSPEFASRLIEKNHGELGRLLLRWVREERTRVPKGDGGRADIVEQMERLAQRGVIDRPIRLPPPMPRPGLPAGQAQRPLSPLGRPVPRALGESAKHARIVRTGPDEKTDPAVAMPTPVNPADPVQQIPRRRVVVKGSREP